MVQDLGSFESLRYLGMSDELRLAAAPDLKEFRDAKLWWQYVLGTITGAGIFGVIALFRYSDGGTLRPLLAGTVVLLTLTLLAVIYLKFGQPIVLRQTEYGIERICGNDEQVIPYTELFGLRAKWTEVLRNGVYSHTRVRFGLCSQDPEAPELTYESTVEYGTPKYLQLQDFQREVAEIVARRMTVIMGGEGHVVWTDKLRLRPDGLEVTKATRGPTELIEFDRLSHWRFDQDLFKLDIDGGRRPALVEDVSQWNFYPGLLLFSQLCQSPSDDAQDSPIEGEPVLIG
jgi:hypothetical protein